MKIALVVPVAAGSDDDRAALLARHATSVAHAEALARAGATVHLVVHGSVDAVSALADGATLHAVSRWLRGAGLVAYAEALQPDVLHLFHLLAVPAATRAALAPARVFAEYNGGGPPRRRLVRWLLKDATENFDGLLFTAEGNAAALLDAGALSPRTTIYEVPEVSAHLPVAERRTDPDRRSVLIVSRFHPDKDPECALEVLREVARRNPAVRFVWAALDAAGGAALMQAAAADPLLSARLRFEIAAPRSAMPQLYAAADVLLHTSRREVCGYAFVEALAAGVPVAASAIPPFSAMAVDRAVRLCEVGAPAAFADAVIDLLADPAASSVATRHFAEALSFDAIAARRLAVYRHPCGR